MKQHGFTLIELLIAVAIVAILAAIAYPSYQNQVIKSRRADGMQLINEVMQAQERFFINQQPFTYTTDLTDLGYPSAANVLSEREHYRITATACGTGITECVLLTAVPQGVQASDGNLTLNSRGTKTGNWP